MSKTAMIRARVEPKLKEEAESLFAKLGLSATEAINLFYRQVTLRRGLPFDVVVPNRLTRRTIEDARKGKQLTHSDTKEAMFKRLGV